MLSAINAKVSKAEREIDELDAELIASGSGLDKSSLESYLRKRPTFERSCPELREERDRQERRLLGMPIEKLRFSTTSPVE